MENMETYWAIVNQTIAIINILIEGWLVYSFVKPFMKKKAYCAGVSYSLVMLVLYLLPQQIDYPYLLGMLGVWIVMALSDRRNIKQKVFLATSLYLLRWVVHGVAVILRDIMFSYYG